MSDIPAFENFDLQIEAAGDDLYRYSVPSSPTGELARAVEARIDLDSPEMRGWLAGLRTAVTTRPALVALGMRLMLWLLPEGPVRELYVRSRARCDARGLRLRLRLRIAPPELVMLPWEYAFDDAIDDFLVFDPRVALVRYQNQPVAPEPIRSHSPVPILLLVANPMGTEPLDAVDEVAALADGLAELAHADRLHIDLLFSGPPDEQAALERLVAKHNGLRVLPGQASLDSLRAALRAGYRVIHYIGHAVFDDLAGGELLLADEDGAVAPASAETLARELRGSSVALVILNACETAMQGTARSFVSVAAKLVQAEVPAVVAMQYAILDTSAVRFARALYDALADGWPLDGAVTEGRKAIIASGAKDDMDWGVPVLFMRAPNGVLWRVGEDGTMSSESKPDQPWWSALPAQTRGDILVIDVGANARNVAAGKNVSQVVTDMLGAPTPDDKRVIEQQFATLLGTLRKLDGELDTDRIEMAEAQIDLLQGELSKTEEDQTPSASTITKVGSWLLKNVPQIAEVLAGIFATPAVGKVVGKAGEAAVEWVQERFGK